MVPQKVPHRYHNGYSGATMAAIYISSLFSMSVKYLWAKSATGSYYFKRRVPLDVREKVGKDFVQECLHTRDLKTATRKIRELVAKTDADWSHLRNPSRGMSIEKAKELLRISGVDPSSPKDSEGLDIFHDRIEEQLPDSVLQKYEEAYQNGEFDPKAFQRDIASHLSPEVALALQITQGTLEILASDCLELYQRMRPGTPQAEKTNKIPFTYLIEHLGNRDIRKYRRSDVNSFVQYMLTTKGIKTTTIQRYINTLRAAWNLTLREHELEGIKNPWESTEIPKLGQDAEERPPFTVADYRTLYTAIGKPQDDLRAMLILLAETGARLGEIVGLGVDDCMVKGKDAPYITLRHRPWRRLKNDESIRKVPLTPKAFDALKLALKLREGSEYLFPRYVDGQSTNATAASSTLNKYIRAQGIDLTVHSLRHGMTDLLREVRCPEPLRKAIQGWAKGDISEHYGAGYSLEAMRGELLKATSLIKGKA